MNSDIQCVYSYQILHNPKRSYILQKHGNARTTSGTEYFMYQDNIHTLVSKTHMLTCRRSQRHACMSSYSSFIYVDKAMAGLVHLLQTFLSLN